MFFRTQPDKARVERSHLQTRHMNSFLTLASQIPWEEILVNGIGGFLAGLALLWVAMGTQGIRSLRLRLGRPSLRIERRKTPENIFSGLELGAPAEWIKQQLGAPTRVSDNWWGYRFSDSLVCLTFDSRNSLQTIAVGLTDQSVIFEFPTWHFDCPPLGQTTLRDLIGIEHLTLTFNDSLRHRELRLTGREGPSGAWRYIAFGALNPNTPGSLIVTEFDWDKQRSVLISRPQDIKVNWAALSTTSEIDGIPWMFALQ